MTSFAATVGDWCRDVPVALEIVFKESAQELVDQMQMLVPRDTGFLRSSLMASTSAMPTLHRENPGVAVPDDLGEVLLVIAGTDLGDTLYLGYTANYAYHVHAGSGGRTPRPWVTIVAQRWNEIVATKAAEVRKRMGL